MAWSIIGVGTVAETTTTTLTLTEPAGIADGDLLVACFASRTTATTAVSNTGWTAVNSQNNNNTLTTTSALASGTMLYQVRAGAPDLSFVVPAGISVIRGQIVAYRGNATTTPLDVTTAVTTAINTTAVSGTGLTTTQADDLIVAMTAGGQEAAWSAFNATTPAGASGATDTTTAPSATWRERADSLTTTGADTSLAIFDALKTTAGATGNLTATASLGAGHVVIAGAFKILPLPSTADAWNVNDKSVTIALSNTDKTATSSGSNAAVRSTTKHTNGSAGLYYAELLAGSTSLNVGIRSQATVITDVTTDGIRVVASTGAIFLGSATNIGNIGSAYTTNDVICIAWNAGTERLWVRKNGNNWNNDASADPATETNGLDVSALPNTDFCLSFIASSGHSATIRTELAEYTQAVPSGFKSWMGETPLVNRTIAADAGSYALTGADATLTKAGGAVSTYTLTADAGSYTLTGATAGLYRGREVLAVAGSYALTGAAASLECGREVASDPGAYALTGTAASLELGREVLGVAGSYAVSGATASLEYGREVGAVAGSYALTGATAALTKGAAIVHRTLPAVAGSYVLTGTAASLEAGREVLAVGGSYAVTGAASSLEYGREVLAVAGSYTLTGAIATFRRTWKTGAVSGSYTLSGAAATFRRTWKVTAIAGAYTLTGIPVNLLKPGAYAIIGLPGSYALGGATTSLEIGREVLALSGAYALSGQAGSLEIGREILALGGGYTLSGAPVNLLKSELTGLVGVWNGSAWVQKPAKVWSGAAWVQKPVKVWNGASWV